MFGADDQGSSLKRTGAGKETLLFSAVVPIRNKWVSEKALPFFAFCDSFDNNDTSDFLTSPLTL